METQKKIQELKNKVENLKSELQTEIYEICENLDYVNASNFSYNIDRLKQFTDGLINFEYRNTDLFNNYENLPPQVQKIIIEMNTKELDYIDLKYYNDRMILENYIFDFDLSAIPTNLRKIEYKNIQDIINTDIYGLLND
jgi:hypothetical protein